MQLVVLCSEESKPELTAQRVGETIELRFAEALQQFLDYPTADAFFDLDFEPDAARIEFLKSFDKPVIINSVIKTLSDIGGPFIRINAWPGFLRSPIIEASCKDEMDKEAADLIFEQLGKKVEWLPDDPGFVSPRVISAVINEAYFALSEGVSTREDIDMAMKLGTAYPYGPFEWGQKIGPDKIVALLRALSLGSPSYAPSALLLAEIGEQLA